MVGQLEYYYIMGTRTVEQKFFVDCLQCVENFDRPEYLIQLICINTVPRF